MTNQKIIPLGRKVLVKDKQPQEFFPGTKIIKAQVEKEYIAEMTGVGDAVEGIEVGDVVRYSKHADGIVMRHDGENHTLINYDMIFAKIIDG